MITALLVGLASLSWSGSSEAPACQDSFKTPGPTYVEFQEGQPVVGDHPYIGFITGDGIGKEISPAVRHVVDEAVKKAYGGSRQIAWQEIPAGEDTFAEQGDALPDSSVALLKRLGISIKGPMNTPQQYTSPNVRMRQALCLYSCQRPVVYFSNVPSPMKNPGDLNLVIFRENTEDVYSGIEFKAGSIQANILRNVINFLQWTKSSKAPRVAKDSAIGIKPMSQLATERHMRRALQYAVDHQIDRVTIVHKGNIMKQTEFAFKTWSYDLAKREFGDLVITDAELWEQFGGKIPEGKILHPEKFRMLVTPNLNGDYLSDAAAAQVGGLGIAPGANIGDHAAVFEATHGTAPDIAGQDKANPTSLFLSAIMMLDYMGWGEAARLMDVALSKTFAAGVVTGDLRAMPGATIVGTKEFSQRLIESL